MARTKAPPKPTFTKVKPPKRAIVVSAGTMAFCKAVYAMGLDPADAWRATSVEQAREMQAAWAAKGISAYIVPLPEMLRESDEDETADERPEAAETA